MHNNSGFLFYQFGEWSVTFLFDAEAPRRRDAEFFIHGFPQIITDFIQRTSLNVILAMR